MTDYGHHIGIVVYLICAMTQPLFIFSCYYTNKAMVDGVGSGWVTVFIGATKGITALNCVLLWLRLSS